MQPLYSPEKLNYIKKRLLTFFLFSFFSLPFFSQTVTITAPVASATYCAGTNITVNYTVTSNFGAGNIFTTQLSDPSGSFATPLNLGTRTATNSGGSTFLIPYLTPGSSVYRVRVLTSNPTFTSQSNGVDLTINGLSISTPTLQNNFFCQGETFSCSYTQSCNFATGNTYSVQLSDAAGSFTAPVTIGTRSNTTAAAITCTVPPSALGSGYRIRIVSSNPSITSPDNGYNILINATAGSPNVAGNGSWYASCFNIANNYSTNYEGYFTENNLSFDTRTRYVSTLCPSTTSASANGNAYAGCTFTNTNNYSVNLKRTNIPCGYYDFSIVGHDDEGRILIDGVQVYYNAYIGGGPVPNAYRAFISPTNTVEVRYSNTGSGPGFMAINISTVNILNPYSPITICAGTSGTLAASNTSTVPLSAFSWSPAGSITGATTGTVITASPLSTTIYTVMVNEPVSGCSTSNTIQVTVNPVPATSIAATSSVMCSGITQVTLSAGGAASYTWSPAAGLSSVNGTSVIANPTITTTYTVSGSNNCSTVNASTLVTVQNVPAMPTPTVYGNNTWNVYGYNDQAFTNYYGYYTENNLSFSTSARWNAANAPSSCTTTATGLAYSGCNITPTSWSMKFRRTNIPCGYYQIDIPSKDDNLRLNINGVQTYSANGGGAVSNIWSGFIGPTTLVEFTLVNTGGSGSMSANFISIPYPYTGPPITMCAGGPATITASPFISGATYSWTPNIALSPTTGTAVTISPTTSIVYTVTVSDPVTTCSASATQIVNVNPLPTTTVSPTSGTIACPMQSVTLTAGGANTYSWSPAAGLNTTTGYSVIATPSVTTIYTVTGNNVCANVSATATISVVPLVPPSAFSPTVWNVYGHNNTTFSNYYGYYTHFGTGTTGYDFNTATQWASGLAPSTATANASGTAYQGCTMAATNISLSFKRTNFACGTYSVATLSNDDNMALVIDGVQVATRATATTSLTIWVGTLNANSQVEFRLNQGTGSSGLSVKFTAAAPVASLSTWVGGTSTDWFTASNWCGSGVPTVSIDALIPNSKPQFMPEINGAGAACRSLTISAATPTTATNPALPSASLTAIGSSALDVYGNWVNNGVFICGSGQVNILGAASTSITGTATQTFYDLVINKTGTVTVSMPAGVHQIGNSMTLTNGIINQAATLRFLNASTVSGASNTSYVNGQVIKVGTQAFTFPVGVSSFYRPISITAPSVVTDHFTAQYFLADPSPPYLNTSKDASIDHIGQCEYWILNRTGGSSNVRVTLTWDITSCGVQSLPDLLVARWDAGQVKWKDEGNGGTTGTTAAGSIITGAPVTLFSPFTLASRNASNPLPIELVSFNCDLANSDNVGLTWVTATETNTDYFSVERSVDGINFTEVGKQTGAGTSLSTLSYTFNDKNALKGNSYYRLKMFDKSGKFKYSEICSVTNNGTRGNVLFYPNPVMNILTIDFTSSESNSKEFSITDVSGKLVNVSSTLSGKQVIVDCSALAEGIYFFKLIADGKEIVNKFTIQR
jgi:hypothetical protein